MIYTLTDSWRQVPLLSRSLFADVLVPQRRTLRNESREHLHTLLRRKINHFDSVFLQPVHSAAKVYGFSDDYGSYSKLTDEPAAVPARRKRRHHNFVAIAFLAPRFAKRIGLPVSGRIPVLHSAVVTAAQEFAGKIKQRCADWNSPFGKPASRFFDCHVEHPQIFRSIHLEILAAFATPKARRDCVVELHKNNEPDAPIRIENTEQRSKCIKRLRNHNAPTNCPRNFRRRVTLDQRGMRCASPTKIQQGPEEQYIGPIGDKCRAKADELNQKPCGKRHERNQKKKREMNPGEVALRTFEMVKLGLLANPENT